MYKYIILINVVNNHFLFLFVNIYIYILNFYKYYIMCLYDFPVLFFLNNIRCWYIQNITDTFKLNIVLVKFL